MKSKKKPKPLKKKESEHLVIPTHKTTSSSDKSLESILKPQFSIDTGSGGGYLSPGANHGKCLTSASPISSRHLSLLGPCSRDRHSILPFLLPVFGSCFRFLCQVYSLINSRRKLYFGHLHLGRICLRLY